MKIGEWTLNRLYLGRFFLDGGAMFGVVPKTLWQKVNPADNLNRIELSLSPLLIQGYGRKIIVDCGIGNAFDSKLKEIYGVNERNINEVLGSFNLSTSDITDVIISHLHFDHSLGAVRRKGEEIVLTFPNAKFWIHTKNIEHALSPTPKDRASFFMELFRPVLESSSLVKVTKEEEIAPGVSLLIHNGHMAGQILVKVTDKTKTLVFTSDTIPTSSHIPLNYIMSYDNFPLTTLEEKKALLKASVAESWILYFPHDPKIAACTVKIDEKGRYVRNIDAVI